MPYRSRLLKPDGRELLLYARAPLPGSLTAPTPPGETPPSASHLRWHPLRREWVLYAGHRNHRTFLPPPGWNPLAPSTDPERPSEVPAGPWEVAVFENRFATLSGRAAPPPSTIVDTRAAAGHCEVIVFTQDPEASLSRLPIDRVDLIIQVWAERTRELGARDDIAYVMPFENRGAEIGASLHQPHGQIYAYPFVPPVAARHLEAEREHFATAGATLLSTLTRAEFEEQRRVVYCGPDAVSYVPVCARHPYEQWVMPRRPVAWLHELDDRERLDLAHALHQALARLDGLWQTPMPYILVVYQAPTDGQAHPSTHAHIQIYPAMRMAGRQKFLGGSELGGGAFAADVLPEQAADALRAVVLAA